MRETERVKWQQETDIEGPEGPAKRVREEKMKTSHNSDNFFLVYCLLFYSLINFFYLTHSRLLVRTAAAATTATEDFSYRTFQFFWKNLRIFH